MSLYFAGIGLDAYHLSFTNTPAYDGSGGIQMTGQGSSYADAILLDPTTSAPAAQSTCWTRFIYSPGARGFQTGVPGIQWFNSFGQVVLQFTGNGADGNSGFDLQRWNGSAFVTVATFLGIGTAINTFDVFIDIGVSGKIEFYLNGALGGSYPLDTSAMGNIAKFRQGAYAGDRNATSQACIIASFNTISHTVRLTRPNGAGALQNWAGAYTGVNGNDINDSAPISTSTTGNVETFTHPALSATPAGNVIKGVTIGIRGRVNNAGVSPANIAAAIRIGGTTYASPAIPINAGFGGNIAIFEKDPSTGGAWASITNVNSEFGVKALA